MGSPKIRTKTEAQNFTHRYFQSQREVGVLCHRLCSGPIWKWHREIENLHTLELRCLRKGSRLTLGWAHARTEPPARSRDTPFSGPYSSRTDRSTPETFRGNRFLDATSVKRRHDRKFTRTATLWHFEAFFPDRNLNLDSTLLFLWFGMIKTVLWESDQVYFKNKMK